MSSPLPDVPLKRLLPLIVLFLILPVAAMGYYVLLLLNAYFGVLQSGAGILSEVRVNMSALMQTVAFGGGMVVAATFYSFRFRFLLPAALLFFGLYAAYGLVQHFAIGEFDGFFLSVAFLTYGVLFALGWIVGWGFVRWRYWHMLVAALFLLAGILTVVHFSEKTYENLVRQALPLTLAAVYLVFIGEQIYRKEESGAALWKGALRRLAVFVLLLGGLSLAAIAIFRPKITQTIAKITGENGKGEKEKGMVKEDKSGAMSLKNSMTPQAGFKRSKELVFAAHINNFFPGTKFPNPLYLTSFYYSKFDSETETFERDSLLPESDLFQPDLNNVPLFRTLTDSVIYRRQKRHELMKDVEIEVYSKRLSKSNFLAPHIGYWVQPITVEEDFKDEFSFAYRSHSLSSELNSAYFVYNVNAEKNPEIAQFQEDRFTTLRKEKKVPIADNFRRYYTTVPADPKWNQIRDLAQQLSAGKKTTIDKVLTIRDFFTAKDAAGNPTFQYSDNPGIPDIPSASRLSYFLFENRKGYCAYYAGATLFLLRFMGIPSRIAVGYLTVDRSGGKNEGWYWYYADQAHAWVQVYFPGYGWLDFDTTVGNSEAQESPQPDGTPPMQPPKAILAIDGLVESVDTATGVISLRTTGLTYKDQPLTVTANLSALLNGKAASIRQDTLRRMLRDIHKDDTLTGVAYRDIFKVEKPQNATAFLAKAPRPLPVDELYLKPKVSTKNIPQNPKTAPAIASNKVWWIVGGALLLLSLIALWLAVPRLLLRYLKKKISTATDDRQKVYWAARAARYRLGLQGLEKSGSFEDFSTHADAALNAHVFRDFNCVYQKVRFSPRPLSEAENAVVEGFYPAVEAAVKQQFTPKQIRLALLQPGRAVAVFQGQKPETKRQ